VEKFLPGEGFKQFKHGGVPDCAALRSALQGARHNTLARDRPAGLRIRNSSWPADFKIKFEKAASSVQVRNP
jgi:hypothetical protein